MSLNTKLSEMREGILEPERLDRHALIAAIGALALIAAPALLVLPKGLSLFGALLIVMTILLRRRLPSAWREAGGAVRMLLLLAALMLGVSMLSMQLSGQGWSTIDNASRQLLLPWCALVAYAATPSRLWLWRGAMVGIVLAFVLALAQASSGLHRAGAGSNPLVFANAVLTLLVLAVYCRPPGRRWRVLLPVMLAFALGTATIVLSGSRGVLPGLGLLLLVAVIGGGRRRWLRLGVAGGVMAAALTMLWSVPMLAEQTRLHYVRTDLQAYSRGHVDTPIGARIEFLAVAGRAFAQHPLTGVGIDRFGGEIRRIPVCTRQDLAFCKLGHAHNDLAEWAATMGLPGLATIVLIYLLPALLFVRLLRRAGAGPPIGSAWAGLMLIAMYVLSGMTQSMFAHALSATIYAVFVGLLLGIALREAAAGEQERNRNPGAATG